MKDTSHMLQLILLNGLVVFIITFTLISLGGPFDAFEQLRKLVGLEYDDIGNVISTPTTFFQKLFYCFWCMAFWVSLIVSIVFVLDTKMMNIGAFIYMWLASVAIAGILNSVVMR